jgi:uncharacterized protein YceH (UPF0502 family)
MVTILIRRYRFCTIPLTGYSVPKEEQFQLGQQVTTLVKERLMFVHLYPRVHRYGELPVCNETFGNLMLMVF